MNDTFIAVGRSSVDALCKDDTEGNLLKERVEYYLKRCNL